MKTNFSTLTDAQEQMVTDLDDVNEHVSWEFDQDEYEGPSTCGFASVTNVDGNGSFVRRIQSLAESDYPNVDENRHGYEITVSGLELSLRKNHDGGYRLSITNVQEFRPGPEFQRMDVREALHELMLQRLQYNGYLQDAYVTSRMD